MECPSCGVSVAPGTGFCSDCRRKLRELHTPEVVKECPKCSRESPSSAKFCAECGASMNYYDDKLGLLTAAGTLTIVASAFCAACGIICFYLALVEDSHRSLFILAALGFVELLVFGFGLTSGILTLKRRFFRFAAFGQVLIVLFAGALLVWRLGAFVMLGVVPLVFAGTAIAFTRTARRAFR